MFKKPSSGKKGNLSQFGLLDVDLDDDDEPMDLDDDDIDLEAELAAISGGGPKRHRPRKPAPVPSANLDAMIAESLKDIPSDEDVSDGDDDPDLLDELKELAIDDDEAPPPPPRSSRPAPPPPGAASGQSSTISLLQDRISNYALAEKTAKESGESGRARRFGRGLKTLNDLLKQAKAGKPVKDEDIPPPVSLGKAPSAPPPEPAPAPPEPAETEESAPASEPEEPPSLPEPTTPPPPPPQSEAAGIDPEKQQGLQIILRRQAEFKAAALSYKRAGDKTMALEFLKVVKQFDMVVQAYKAGQEMDLSELPTTQSIEAAIRSQKEEAESQNTAEPTPPAPAAEAGGLITASTVDEALRQRLAAFQQQEAKAKEEGNSAKARRLGRVVKQYQDAIRSNAAGKPIAADELPTPAGYAPLPTGGSAPATPRPAPAQPRPAPAPPAAASRHDRQLALLLQRQKQFKEAALKAKMAGDIEQAKEYLRAMKGFDSVIEAARGGLVVDLKSLPLPPKAKTQLENTFDIVSAEDCGPSSDGPATIHSDDRDVFTSLHNQLTSQLKLCLENRDHNRAMGHVAEANRFEHLAVAVQQDLDIVSVAKSVVTKASVFTSLHNQLTSQLKLCLENRDHNRAMGHVAEANRFEHLAVAVQQDLDIVSVAKSLNRDPPKFHYESRQFSVVQCNTDLNENDLELTIVRGIAYNVPNPKDIDTYVKFEFPYPQDAPVSDRTSLIKDTNSPEYNAVFPLAIARAARPCLRVFKRHAIKFEVYSRGGWFSRDALLGAASVKLEPLQAQVTLHEAFPVSYLLLCCSGWFSRDALLGAASVKLEPLQAQVTLHEAFPVSYLLLCCSGWFSRDALLGAASVKLEPLQAQVTLHEAFPVSYLLLCCSGWFSRDALLGAASVKLEPLQAQVTLHEAFPVSYLLLCCSGWFSRDALLGAASVKLEPLQAQVTLHEAFPVSYLLLCCSGWFSRDALLGAASVKLEPLQAQVTLHEAFPVSYLLLCCSGWFSRDALLGAASVKLEPLQAQVTLHEAFPVSYLLLCCSGWFSRDALLGAASVKLEPLQAQVTLHEAFPVSYLLLCCSGWFSRDALLGAASVKLEPLQAQVTLHEAFPLMDGRRPAGGSLEVKLRVRTPLLQQQVAHATHRWLVVDT